jgi:hypothetical protein
MRTAVTTDLEEPRALKRRKSNPFLSFLSIIARARYISQHAMLKNANSL